MDNRRPEMFKAFFAARSGSPYMNIPRPETMRTLVPFKNTADAEQHRRKQLFENIAIVVMDHLLPGQSRQKPWIQCISKIISGLFRSRPVTDNTHFFSILST
jgi:hypothetical protein